MTKKKLQKILKYKNPSLIQIFKKNFGLSTSITEEVFRDMLRYLWLCQRAHFLHRQNGKNTPSPLLLSSMSIVDEMWHLFILHTNDYKLFCHKYFGDFIHHYPQIISDVANRKKTSHQTKKDSSQFHNEVLKIIDFVQDELGYEVAKRWYITYPKKYSQQEIYKRLLKYSCK